MNQKLLDNWVKSYNKSIKESERRKEYPFYGYTKLLEEIYILVSNFNSPRILEMGIGTGQMVLQLYKDGHDITGIDFSEEMISQAKSKMPYNKYIHKDFLSSLQDIENEKYDVIIFSYSIHHLKPINQKYILDKLSDNLSKNGIIIIADVIKKTKDDMEQLTKKFETIWDYDEHYPTLEQYENPVLNQHYSIKFKEVTECSGLIMLNKKSS